MKVERKKRNYRSNPIASEMEQNMRKAYLTALNKIANQWIHDEDSGCDWANTAHKERLEFGPITFVYQHGKKSDGWIKEGHVLFIIDKKEKIGTVMRRKIQTIIGECNRILVADYHNALEETGGNWFKTVREETAENILAISKPFECKNPHFWKLTFIPLDDIHGSGSWGWNPKCVQQELGVYDENWYNEVIQKIKNN